MKILIADDDEVVRVLLQQLSETMGHTCTLTSDGAQAWEAVKNEHPDVVISDWMMPEMDGVELCRNVRSLDSDVERYTYFIFLTVRSDMVSFLTAMREGADDYLTKPLSDLEVRVRLGVAQRLVQAQHQLREQQETLTGLNRMLENHTRIDSVTGLTNRIQLLEDLGLYEARAHHYGYRYAVALVGLDDFEPYRRQYGDTASSRMLCTVADSLRQNARQGDQIYRYDPDEFAIVLPEQDRSGAIAAGERQRNAIGDLGLANAADGFLTVSVGLAVLPPRQIIDAATLLSQAHVALLMAKREGGDRVVGFEDAAATTGVATGPGTDPGGSPKLALRPRTE